MSAERDVEALEARLDFAEREAIRLMAEVARLTAENERLVAQIRAALQDESGLPTRLALAVAISALLNAAFTPQADAAGDER